MWNYAYKPADLILNNFVPCQRSAVVLMDLCTVLDTVKQTILIETSEIANLISKLNFYKLIPYPMDNSLSGRRRPARQTSEKDVLCLH